MAKSHLLFFCFIQLLFVHAIEYDFDCDGTTITVSERSESAAGVAKPYHIKFGPKTHPNIEISKTNDEGHIEVLQYNYRAPISGGDVHWVLGSGARTEVYTQMVSCGHHNVANVINYALNDDSVVRILIGAHVLKGASTVHLIHQHIAHGINVIDLQAAGVAFKFTDVDGKVRQMKFEPVLPHGEDRQVIMIGAKSYSFNHAGAMEWQCSEFEPGDTVPTISFVSTDALRLAIAGRLGSHVAIKIGKYTLQRETPVCHVRATAESKIVKPKVLKPKAVVELPEKTIEYQHCSIELPDQKHAHPENPYIMDLPNGQIVDIIQNAFPIPHKSPLEIYDYAVNDMTAHGLVKYLEFISVVENFDGIIRKYKSWKKKIGFGKQCTPEMALMKVYKIYIGTAIEFDDYSIETRLKEAASYNFDSKRRKEIDTKKGAWKDAKNEVYGKIKNYFDTCIPLSSPHTTNTRVQKTPTAKLAGFITEKFGLKTDENIQKMYDVLIEMCGEMCVCENYEFISAMQYLKEIFKKSKHCDTEMMHVYRAYINMRTATPPINIEGPERADIGRAATTDFKLKETDPNEGLWRAIESLINTLIKMNLDNPSTKREIKNKYDESGAKESYYNELINYNEYYDSVYDGEYSNSNNGYDVAIDSEYSNSNTYNGYDHSNSNNYNGGNRNSNFNLMNPILMLIGLIFCLCFICAALLNVISCGCCYVFGRYQTKIGDYKTQNDYEYNNNI